MFETMKYWNIPTKIQTNCSAHDSIHRLAKITDRTLDVVFSRFWDFSYTITRPEGPESEVKRSSAHSALKYKIEREHTLPVRNSFGFSVSGLLWKKKNLEKTTSNVLSAVLINLWSNTTLSISSKISRRNNPGTLKLQSNTGLVRMYTLSIECCYNE